MKELRDYLYNEIKEVEKQCNELAEEIEKTKVENKEDHFNFVFNQGRLFQLKTILVKLLTEDEE
jgi:vacuolar-type H+-ATPase subunit D/Vma8